MVRTTVRQRVDSENKVMPTTEALLLHWKRCMWIIAMWHSGTSNAIDLPGMLCHTVYNHTHYCVTFHFCSFNRLRVDKREWETADSLGSP